MSPAARRALRNVVVLWLCIVAVAGAAASRVFSGGGDGGTDGAGALTDLANAANAWIEAIVFGGEAGNEPPAWAHWAMKTALPVMSAHERPGNPPDEDGPQRPVRLLLRTLAGLDVADPAALLAHQLPGFDAALALAADTLPASARALSPPGRAGSGSTVSDGSRADVPPVASRNDGPQGAGAELQPGRDDRPPAGETPGTPGDPRRAAEPTVTARIAPETPDRPSQPPAPPEPPAPPDSPWDRLRAVAWGNDCRVLIYHTHTSEMYRTATFAPADPEQYHVFNTTDTGIVRVGRAIADRLAEFGIPACHLTDVHDWPSHPRAYIEARATVEKFLRRNPQVEIVLDVHRDSPSGLVTTVAGRRAAQIAFVLGTNGSMHPNWPLNVAFARELAALLDERHPGLFRRIIERPDARLNQDLHPRAILVEIGSYDTYLEEAVLSGEIFADVLADMLHVIRFGRSVLEASPSP